MGVDELEQRITERAAQLMEWCREYSHWVSPDGRINPTTAAIILDRSEKTLRSWRSDHYGPEYHQYSKRGRVTYRLDELARFIESDGD